jgi:sulfur-oxidizing protein SoxA
MKRFVKIALSVALLSSVSFSGDQFAMSDADRAMYAAMQDANPADMMVAEGGELLKKYCGGDAGLAKFLHVSEKQLPSYIAGFPRYLPDLKKVVGIDQVLQALMAQNGGKPLALKDTKMFYMVAYTKSLANDEKINIDVNANQQMKDTYALGEKTFNTQRGGRGLSCNSCHSPDIIGSILRTQPLPDLGVNNSGGSWPAYRMTKSSMSTMQHRFQGCMDNSLMAIIPLGSPEMVGLEVYVTNYAKGKAMAIPGLKR